MIRGHQGIKYALNYEFLTDEIISIKSSRFDIQIPFSIFHKSREFIITEISEFAFEESKFDLLEFTENSKIVSIPSNAFYFSEMQQLHLPKSIKRLDKKWCSATLYLNKITVSKNNKYFKDNNGKILFGKSNDDEDNYDILYFASRDLETITIPSTIKEIKSYTFENCEKLKVIEFEKESNIKTIGECAFKNTSITTITIPNSVKFIDEEAFYMCEKLMNIIINEDSELSTIGSRAFSYSKIEEIYFPSKIKTLKEGWCASTSELKRIKVSSNNPTFISIGNEILIGKSNDEENNYEYLYFASRDLETITIPSTINEINLFSIAESTKISTIEIKTDHNFKLSAIWLDLPTEYQNLLNDLSKNIYSATIKNMYSKFTFKYHLFKNEQFENQNFELNLFF